MRIEENEDDQKKAKLTTLELVNFGRTNINQVKFLSHYEHNGSQKILKSLAKDPTLFLANLYKIKYQIFDAKIAPIGEILNFKLRINGSQNINEINILPYLGNAFIPKEVRGFIPDEEIIYTIRFYSAKKIEIEPEQVNEYVEMENLVLYEDEKYFHIILGESVEKGWVEDPIKGIFYLKSLGFYIGANDPNIKENIELLKSYGSEEEILMSATEPINIDDFDTSIAIIEKRKINWKLSDSIQFKFKVFGKKIPKKINVLNKYKTLEENGLLPDKISEEVEKLKMPRKPPIK